MMNDVLSTDYKTFLESRARYSDPQGFEPVFMPDFLFDFQKFMVEWACREGRAALFEECGLGKTAQQLVWAENVVRKTNRPVMLATPIAVGAQTVREADKFGITARRTRDGRMTDEACIWVTNYEQLSKYDPSKFAGFVGDESSAIKDFKSSRRGIVFEFCRNMQYRLLCSATPAPNDFDELGNSSDVLGRLGYRDMVTTFFKQETSKDNNGWGRMKMRFRGHAEEPFWAWVCSWARSMRKPSDLGFDDSRFALPPLVETEHVVKTAKARSGMLFAVPARDMREERAERRHSIVERCELAASLANGIDGPVSWWAELNDEADELERIIPNCVQVSGTDSDEEKEEKLSAFTTGDVKRIVLKPAIGAWGLNWQHCADAIVFPSHSFERYYQLVRRFYRFGQKRSVNVRIVVSEGEQGIVKNLRRKEQQAEKMFASIVAHMKDAMHLATKDNFHQQEVIPSWL